MAVTKSFDLSEEILELLARELAPRGVVDEFARRCAGVAGEDRAALGRQIFGDYGRRWMERTVELGEEYSDRTYETMKQVAGTTGLFAFPHIPQRFFEIAYLGIQPIPFLKIVLNNQRELLFRLNRCAVYDLIQETCGEEVAAELPCKQACLVAGGTLFERLGMKASFRQVATMPAAGKCEFSAVRG